MKMKPAFPAMVFALLLFVSATPIAFADRQLDRTEILRIFQQLTDKPRTTWIPTGTIQAIHEQYGAPKTTDNNRIEEEVSRAIRQHQADPSKAGLSEELQKMSLDAIPFNVRYRLSNECMMRTTEIVKFDGHRFYWEISADSRSDSVRPGSDLEGNFMTKRFDMDWNRRRIFAWDGEKYTTYFLPGNCAIVDSTGSTPRPVNGPLTAGVVPWGHGRFTYENLALSAPSATETSIDGQPQISTTLEDASGTRTTLVLDPAKDYAVIQWTTEQGKRPRFSRHFSGYHQVSGSWVPSAILIEQYDAYADRLLTHDLWSIVAIDPRVPGVESFNVEYEYDALIEYSSIITNKPLMYRYSPIVDTDALLAERLSFAATVGSAPQNCATASLKYVLSQLGRTLTGRELARLVSEPNGTTNLDQMKQFASSLGLYARAVKTDIVTLRANLGRCKAILHIPGKNHFVVLDSIDNQYVWTIDLADDRFYYRTETGLFNLDWPEGTALLISDQPIKGDFDEIDNTASKLIIGAAGYSCTKLLQQGDVIFCVYLGGMCDGYYEFYYTRYGCETAQSGSCSSSRMLRYQESPCINDPNNPGSCTITGDWTCYYMWACR